MKLVKLIRPLFLVALGLHGLALFVPIGPQAETVIEDVDIADLDDSAGLANRPENQLTGALPVPDPNVAAAGNAASKLAAKPAVPAPATASPVPRPRPTAVAVRPAVPAPRQPVAAAPRVPVATPANSGAAIRPPAQATSPTAADNASSSTSAEDSSPSDSFLSTVDLPGNADEAVDSGSSSTNNEVNNEVSNETVTVAMLLAEVTQKLPEALKETVAMLEESLTYSAEDTDDESAEKNRLAWINKIQRQTNIGSIEPIEPTESTALTQVNYPIESSQQSSALMRGRNLNVCLDTPKPGKAEVGVLFDASGGVVDQPELIRSTGYGAVDEEIKAIASTQDHFPRDRNSKAYSFEVEVKYDDDACVELSDLK